MEKVSSLAILLVCCIASNAHATARAHNVGGRDTFHVYALNATAETSIKSLETTNHSVVENWSLVCKDLCRFGFGGPRCGLSCIVGSTRQMNGTKTSEFCPVLCDIELGGQNCRCPLASTRLNRKVVCDILCRKLHLQIRGCSKCKGADKDLDNIEVISAIDRNQTTAANETNEPVTTTILFSTITDSGEPVDTTTTIFNTENTSEVSATTTQQPLTTTNTTASASTNGTSQATESTTQILPHTTELTTPQISEATATTTEEISEATAATSTKSSSTTTTMASTTPNWNELCHSLCKIGEGGSLCNCDLPPLMST